MLTAIFASLVVCIPQALAQLGGEGKRIEAVACYLGTSGHVDEARAKTLFQAASQEGDPLATMWVARCYLRGRIGFPKDESKAQDLARSVLPAVKKMADEGHAHALALYANAREDGLGVTVNQADALSRYRAAAERGDVFATNNLGCMLENTGDVRQAALWYRKAAEGGNSSGMISLSIMYQNGLRRA